MGQARHATERHPKRKKAERWQLALELLQKMLELKVEGKGNRTTRPGRVQHPTGWARTTRKKTSGSKPRPAPYRCLGLRPTSSGCLTPRVKYIFFLNIYIYIFF